MSKCLACGRRTWAGDRVHPACRPALIGGKWQPGMVQRWRETVEPRTYASPTGPDMWARLETLTEAEGDVLRLLACGHALNEIAVIRTTTMSTVRTQIKAIRQKLGTQGIGYYGADVALAWRSGWITLADEAFLAMREGGAA